MTHRSFVRRLAGTSVATLNDGASNRGWAPRCQVAMSNAHQFRQYAGLCLGLPIQNRKIELRAHGRKLAPHRAPPRRSRAA
jgi:hypothetical protein